MAGQVEAVGKNVEQFQPGDEIFGVSNFGAFAEYGCFDEKYLAKKTRHSIIRGSSGNPDGSNTRPAGSSR